MKIEQLLKNYVKFFYSGEYDKYPLFIEYILTTCHVKLSDIIYKNYNNFIYCDTDSVHFLNVQQPEDDNYEMEETDI